MSDFEREMPRPETPLAETPYVPADEHAEPVLIAAPQSQEEARVIVATLDAEGIVATLNEPAPNVNNETFGELGLSGVYVSAADADAARAILNAPAPTEDELSDEAMQGESLEEAEARVKDL